MLGLRVLGAGDLSAEFRSTQPTVLTQVVLYRSLSCQKQQLIARQTR